ncbi:MAG: VanZ family protein [Candidatus Omnitrophica bacterium]|nr:VanZ family protein [Candidatus Omnitrophota bacterium]
MSKELKFLSLWLPAFAWAGCIFFFSSIPDLKSNLEYDFVLRKIAHMLEYLILTFLLHRALKGSFKISSFILFIYPAGASFLYAISDEIHQLFVPGRSCSVLDILIDTVGILGFYIIINFFKIWERARLRIG